MRFNRIRSIFKRSPILYRIAFRYYLKHIFGGDGRLPQKGDDFYFDGYAKSGNSSLRSFLRDVSISDLVFSSHLHSIAPLKIALNYKIPSIVIYRDPYNTIASWYFHFHEPNNRIDKELLEWLVSEWIAFYGFVLKKKSSVFITSLTGVRNMKFNYTYCLNNL